MAISHRASGSWAYAASGSVTPTLATHQSGDMLIVRVAAKSSAISTLDITTATSGWARVGQFRNGTTNSGNGTGSVQVAAFYKVATSASETNPTIDFSQTVTQVGHVAITYQKGASETWSTPVGDGGPDTTAGTTHSATIQSHVSVTANDMVDFFHAQCDDATLTVPTITQTGVTFAAVSEQPATAGTDTSGADGSYDGGYRFANSGTSSAAAVQTGTISTSETGTSWMTRLRVFTPEEHSGGFTLTGGGVATTGQQKGGQSGFSLAGGGVVTHAATKTGQLGLAVTGAGVVTEGASTERNGGTALTGGGVSTVGASKDTSGSFSLTGGGTYAQQAEAARLGAFLLSGGGVLASLSSSERFTGLTLTGGGVVEIDGEASFGGPSDGFTLTGGGIVSAAGQSDRSASLTITAGGTATFGHTAEHFGSFTISGGGAVNVAAASSEIPPLFPESGGIVEAEPGYSASVEMGDIDGAVVSTGEIRGSVTIG